MLTGAALLKTTKLEDIDQSNLPQVVEAIRNEPTWDEATKGFVLSLVEGRILANCSDWEN